MEETIQDENKKSINILEFYRNAYKDNIDEASLDISAIHYSNIAYIQVGSRDVSVDFVTLPAVVRDGEIKVEGIRVYMSHTAAQALARKLETLIEDAHNNKLIAELEFQPTEGDSLEK